jgi:hypothetical protein
MVAVLCGAVVAAPARAARANRNQVIAQAEGEVGRERQFTGVVLSLNSTTLVVQKTRGKTTSEEKFAVDRATRVRDGKLNAAQTAVRPGRKIRVHYRATTRGVDYAVRIDLLPTPEPAPAAAPNQ